MHLAHCVSASRSCQQSALHLCTVLALRLTQVVCPEGRFDATRRRRRQSSNVPLREIDYMDEVTNRRPVWRIPVRAEDVQNRLCARQDGGDDRDEVARFLARIFPEQSRFMASNLRRPYQLFAQSERLVNLPG